MDKLRDIKNIVEIPDSSLIYLSIISFCIVLMVLMTIYLWKKYRNNIKNNDKKIALSILKNQDFNNSKVTAYNFNMYATKLLNETNTNEFNIINQQLTNYKYKKQVAKLNEDLVIKIKDFINHV